MWNITPDNINVQLKKETSMLNGYNSGDMSYIYLRDKNGNIVDSFAIQWE
jgi:hypothetical protein